MNGWIGVDYDGTLVEYDPATFPAVGAPIPKMVARVREWLAAGIEVRIVTARASLGEDVSDVEAWCQLHLGQVLSVTCRKDYGLIELWDDRAVQLIPNTGESLEDLVTQLRQELQQWR